MLWFIHRRFFISAKAVTRSGELIELSSKDIKFSYRQCDLPKDCIILEATLFPNLVIQMTYISK